MEGVSARLLQVALLVILLVNIPYAAAASPHRASTDTYGYRVWVRAVHDRGLLAHLMLDVIPPNGSGHDPVAERVFWEHVVPEEWMGGYYAEVLFGEAIPGNWSGGYYYTRFFRDIVARGFYRYVLGKDHGEPFVGRDAWIYYYSLLFKRLVLGELYNGYYYNITINELYTANKWGYAEILANIAYWEPWGAPYALILTQMDIMRELAGNMSTVPTPMLAPSSVPGTGTLYIRLLGPTGPVSGVSVDIYSSTPCTWGLCYGEYVTTIHVNATGEAEVSLVPGTYRLLLGAPAAGIIEDVVVEENSTRNLTVLLGFLRIQLADASGNPLTGLHVSIYTQVPAGGGAAGKGYYVAGDILGTNGTFMRYMVPGTYMLVPRIPGWGGSYITNIVVEPGATNTYSYVLDIVPVHIRPSIPAGTVPSYWFTVEARIGRTPGEGTWLNSRFNGTIDTWLRPGEYVLEIMSMETAGLYIETPITMNFTVGFTETTIYYPVSILHYNPLVAAPASVPYSVSALIGSGPYKETKDLGYTRLRPDTYLVLPPGLYMFKPSIGPGSSQYSFIVSLTASSIYEYDAHIPLGYINVSTIYRGEEVPVPYTVLPQEGGDAVDGSTCSLTPLLPGAYSVVLDEIGFSQPLAVDVEEGVVTNISIALGKLSVNVTGYDGLNTPIPVVVAHYDNATGEIGDMVTYAHTFCCADFYLVPGIYAVIVPGLNHSYAWLAKIGYGEVRVNLNVSEAMVLNETFLLGRLVVVINTPGGAPAGLSAYIVVAGQILENGTPTAAGEITRLGVSGAPASAAFDLVPGAYTVYVESSYGAVLPGTTRYNVVVSPQGLTVVEYNFSVAVIRLLLNETTPAPGVSVDVETDGGPVIKYLETGVNGTAVCALPPGNYTVKAQLPWQPSLPIANITVDGYGVYTYNATYPYASVIKVRVRGPGGEPIYGARIRAVRLDAIGMYGGVTGSGGEATLLVAPGVYRVEAGAAPATDDYPVVNATAPATYVVDLNMSVIKVHFTMPRHDYVAVYIVGEGGAVHRAYLGVDNSSTIVFPALPGNYTIVIPGANTTDIVFSWNRYGYGETVDVEVGWSTAVDVHIELSTITVALDLSGNGTAYELDRYIGASLLGERGGEPGNLIVTKTLSTYGMHPYTYFIVTPGEYAVILNGPPWTSRYPLYYLAGRGVLWGNITLSGGDSYTASLSPGLLLLYVYGEDGAEANVPVSVYAESTLIASSATGQDGSVYFYLTPGSYDVVIRGMSMNVVIEAGAAASLNISTVNLIVELRGPDGEPVVNGYVELYDSGMTRLIDTAYTDADGRAVFTAYPGSEYTVVLPGIGYDYSPWLADAGHNSSYGYGASFTVECGLTDTVLTVNLSRIDVRIDTPLGPAANIPVLLYDADVSSIAKAVLSGPDGYAHIYVAPGNYSVGLRGLLYGWYDYAYAGIGLYDSAGAGMEIGKLLVAGAGEVYSYNVSLAAVEVYIGFIGGAPLSGEEIGIKYVYEYGRQRVAEGETGPDGYAVFYLVPAPYIVETRFRAYSVNLSANPLGRISVVVANITVKVNTPPGIPASGIYIDVYENYTGPGTGEYIGTFTTDSEGYLNITVVNGSLIGVVVPGIAVGCPGSHCYGLGAYRAYNVSGNIYVEFNLSAATIHVESPSGPVIGEVVKVRAPGYWGKIYGVTGAGGNATFLLTPGNYTYTLTYTLHSREKGFSVAALTHIVIDEVVSELVIMHNRSRVGGTISVMVESAASGDVATLYVEDAVVRRIYPGTYIVYTSTLYGWPYSETVVLGRNETRRLVVDTGSMVLQLVDPFGHNVSKHFIADIYLDNGGEPGDYVGGLSGIGNVLASTLRPGDYMVYVYSQSLGYGRYYAAAVEPGAVTYNNITLSAIIVSLIYGNGTPVEGRTVKLLTETTMVEETVTDENGTAAFTVNYGDYMLWIEGIGDIYGVSPGPAEALYLGFTIEPVDLAIEEITWSPALPSDGDTVIVSANITNNGPGHVLRDVPVSFYVNGTLAYQTVIHGLLAGHHVVVAAPITVYAGMNEVRVVVDENGFVNDRDRGNNELTVLIEALRPDLEPLDISLSGSLVDGAVARVSFNITNNGPGSINRRFYVRLYLNSSLIRVFAIDGLAAGSSLRLTASITLMGGWNEIRVVADPGDMVSEANESNNLLVYTVYVEPPDLEVSVLTLSGDMVDGGVAMVTAVVRNNGPGATLRSFIVSLLVDGRRQTYLYVAGGLGVGENYTAVFYIQVRGGMHTVAVMADPRGDVVEASEENNVLNTTYEAAAPDLAVEIAGFTPPAPGPGEAVEVIVNVTNAGPGATMATMYLSLYVDGVFASSRVVHPPFAAGEERSYLFTVYMPAGNHSVAAVIDNERRCGDADRNNNVDRMNITVFYSDLEVIDVSLLPANTTYTSGAHGNISVTVRNNGPGALNKTFYIAVFIDGEFYAQIPVRGIDVNETVTVVTDYVFTAGNHTVEAIADDHYMRCYGGVCVYGHRYEAGDPYRGNNAAETQYYAAGPDLVVVDAAIAPNPPAAWGFFTVNITVMNTGDGALDEDTAVMINIGGAGYMAVVRAPLMPGEAETVAVMLSDIGPGEFAANITVNPFHMTSEHRYDNNVYELSISIPAPDLAVKAVYAPADVVLDKHEEYNVTVTVVNNGWNYTRRDVVVAVRCGGDEIGRGYIYGGLAAGEEVNITIGVPALAPGSMLCVVEVDYGDEVAEANESNNKAYYTSPATRSLSLWGNVFDLIRGVHEDIELAVVNTGGVALTLTGVELDTPYASLTTSLPIELGPGDRAVIGIHVDTQLIPAAYAFNVTLSTNTSYTLRRVIAVHVVEANNTFTVSIENTEIIMSLGETLFLWVVIGSTAFQLMDYEVEATGNATILMDETHRVIHGATTTLLRLTASGVQPGTYTGAVRVTMIDYGIVKTANFTVRVISWPLITVSSPINGSAVASGTIMVSWETNVPANASIYVRVAGEEEWTRIRVHGMCTVHHVMLGGLLENHTYELYIVADSGYGVASTGIYRVTITRSVMFSEHEVNVTISRDYNQLVHIRIYNNDPVFSHRIYAKVINTDPNLVMDFVGIGSTDAVAELAPNAYMDLSLVIHAADTARASYTATAMLVDLDTNATDYMVINIHVEEPVFNVTVELVEVYNATLVQVYRLVNHGDTITDLSVHLAGPASKYAYIYPSMNHVRLRSGEEILFYVIPVLSMYPDDPSLLNGTIVIETRDPSIIMYSIMLPEVPSHAAIYSVPVKKATIRARAHDGYCTNRKHIEVKMKIASDPDMINETLNGTATLLIYFSPQYSLWEVRPHDGTVYVNGVPVYSWQNTIPEGLVAIDVPFSVLGLGMEGGISEVTVTIDTQHMNGGHYVVVTDFSLTATVYGGHQYVVAHSEAEAREIIDKSFKPNVEHVEKKECDRDVKMPWWLYGLINTIPSSLKYDIANLPVPEKLKFLVKKGPASVKASLSVSKSVTPKNVKISFSGGFEVFGLWGVEGGASGSVEWGVVDCSWRFKGGELTGSFMVGYRAVWEVDPSWFSFVTNDKIKYTLKITLGVTDAKILLNDHMQVSAVINFMVGIVVTGEGEIKLGSGLSLSTTMGASGEIGIQNENAVGLIKLFVKGDVKVNAGPWEYAYSLGYAIKFLYVFGQGWKILPLSDPSLTKMNFWFHDTDLGYPYIASPSEYSSRNPGLGTAGGALYAAWVASDNNETRIMLSRYTGEAWTEPAVLPVPSSKWYVDAYPVELDGDVAVVYREMPPFDPSGVTFAEMQRLLGNETVYMTRRVNGSWAAPVTLAHGTGYVFDIASTGSKAVAAWINNDTDGYYVEAMLYLSGSWTAPLRIPWSTPPSPAYRIRDLAVSFIGDKPAVFWITDAYRQGGPEGDEAVTMIMYTVYSGGAWSPPRCVPGAWNATYIDASWSGGALYLAWSNLSGVYLSVYNGSWATQYIGRGYEPEIAVAGGNVVVAARIYNGNSTDIAVYAVGDNVFYQEATSDPEDDASYTLAALPSGRVVLAWLRRPPGEPPEPGYAWAYGLCYMELSNVSIAGMETPSSVVEGNEANVTVAVVNSGDDVDAVLVIYLNETPVASKHIHVGAGEAANYTVSVTPPDKGVYVVRAVLSNITPPTINSYAEATAIVEVAGLLEVSAPSNGSAASGEIRVAGSIRGEKPATITISVEAGDARVEKRINNVTGGFETVIDASGLPEGWANLAVHAELPGSAADDTYAVQLYIDHTPPSITVIGPENTSYVSGTINVSVAVADNLAVSSPPRISVNGTPWAPMIPAGNYTYVYTVDTSVYADGEPLHIYVEAVDAVNNTAILHIVVVPDNTPPVTASNVTGGWYGCNVAIRLSGYDEVSGVAYTAYRVDGGGWMIGDTVVIPAPRNHSNDGVHIIEYYSVDNAGNAEPAAVLVIGIDTEAPVAAITAPGNNSVVGGTITMAGYVDDALSGLVGAVLVIDGVHAVPINGSPWNITINTEVLGDGLHTAVLHAWDAAGNNASYAIVFTVDNTAPSAMITSPANNTYVSGEIAVEMSYSDPHLDRAVLVIDGVHVVDVTGLASYVLDTSILGDGLHVIELVVNDTVGNAAAYSIMVYVDNTPPSVAVTAPAEGTVVRGAVLISYAVEEADPAAAVVYINGTPHNASLTGYLWDTTVYGDGVYNITVVVTDKAGNSGGGTVFVVVDNTPPLAMITGVGNNSYVSGTVSLGIVVEDANPGAALLYIDGVFYANATGLDNVAIDTVELGDGLHVISLVAIDAAGNNATYVLAVIVDNTAPAAEITWPPSGTVVSDTVTVLLSYGDASPHTAMLYIDGVFYANVTGLYAVDIDTSVLGDGNHTVTLLVEDAAGNNASHSITIIVDNTPPEAAILAPGNGTVVCGVVAVEMSYSDPHMASAELYVDGELVAINETSYMWDTAAYSDGYHVLKLVAEDAAGNTRSVYIVVYVDNTAPSAMITAPANGTVVYGVVELVLNYSDATLQEALLYIDGVFYANATGAYSVEVDTAVLSDGSHAFTLVVRDAANHSASSTIVLVVDNNPPVIAITSPVPDSFVEGIVEVVYSYSDATEAVEVILYIDGELAANLTGLTTYLLDTTSLADGSHVLTITARDAASHVSSASVTINVDNTPPEAVITSPGDDAIVSGSLTIRFSYSDTYLERAELYIDGELAADVTGYTSYTVDTAGLADGSHSIELRVYDSIGHVSSDSVTVVVDNTPPAAAITSPASGELVAGEITVVFTYSDRHLDKAVLYIDGSPVADVTGLTSYVLDTGVLGDGQHVVSIAVTDKAGLSSTDSITIIVDNSAPELSVSGLGNGSIASGTVMVRVAAADPHFAWAALYLDGSVYGNSTEEAVVFMIDTGRLGDGNHTVVVAASDVLGNKRVVAISFTVDNTPPELTVSSPVNGTVSAGPLSLVVSVSDASPVAVGYSVDGVVWVNYTGPAVLDPAVLGDGWHTVAVRAVDAAGNEEYAVVTVFFDTEAPLLTVSSPGNNTVVSGVVELAVAVSDASPVELYYRIDGSEPVLFNGSVSMDTSALSDGRHVITVEARDGAGNTAREIIVLYIDNTPPRVIIASPADGSRYAGGEVAVTWSIEEDNLEKTVLVIDGKEIDVTGASSYTINVEELAPGRHRVTVRAIDKAGHAAEETITIYRDEKPAPVPIGLAAAALLIAALAAILVFYLRKK